MSQFDDLPIIRCRPTPTDAELAAEREEKYQAQLANDTGRCDCASIYYPCPCADWPIAEVAG